jgi:hydroxymethylpyrimidine pyrophosphatase-like HAD family hydrolase
LIKDIPGLDVITYKDAYSTDLWFLEIYNHTASKYHAVQFLRQEHGFDHIVGFGDNINDIPLFAACDKKLAVKNALPELKNMADAVIDSNENDGVVKWLDNVDNL